MSTTIQTQHAKTNTTRVNAAPPLKAPPKQQPSGLTREEIRQIVLDMIG